MAASPVRFAARLLSAIAIPAALIFAAPAGAAQDAYGIAATVNDDVITTYDLQQRVYFMVLASGVKPDEDSLRRMQFTALRALIDERLQMQEANKFDLEISDEEVGNALQRLAQGNNLSLEQLTERMTQAGISIETLRDQVRAELAWQRIVNGRFGQRIRVSDTQIDETVRRMSANAGKPSYLISEIYIEATEDIGGMDGALEGARAMITQFEQDAPFTALARQFSSGASSAKGGDVGWTREGELRSEISNVLPSLEKGTISEPIIVPGGVYIILMRDKRDSESESVYTIKQIRVPAENEAAQGLAQTAIREMAAQSPTCDTLEDAAETIESAEVVDMGVIKSSQVGGPVLKILEETEVGTVSDPIAAPNGVMALMVCDLKIQGAGIPTRDEVEDRIIDQQIAQSSRRYLRDVRRSATIESR
ncbi:peptidylprolyl isomerase [Robiginitomaculum antarcticum]|uniref:peptidylprolyl isomerase n=1 Tax=Robiginitomaculum antarcticum TaxID=437507 RepID=UPI00039ECF76|nr:peptidylprolyl isomerase [Robiginitomaculum antarcticum]